MQHRIIMRPALFVSAGLLEMHIQHAGCAEPGVIYP